jgi:hypothetical protein
MCVSVYGAGEDHRQFTLAQGKRSRRLRGIPGHHGSAALCEVITNNSTTDPDSRFSLRWENRRRSLDELPSARFVGSLVKRVRACDGFVGGQVC